MHGVESPSLGSRRGELRGEYEAKEIFACTWQDADRSDTVRRATLASSGLQRERLQTCFIHVRRAAHDRLIDMGALSVLPWAAVFSIKRARRNPWVVKSVW